MVDLLNVQTGLKNRNIEEPVETTEGKQDSYISYRNNEFERTPNCDTVNFKGAEDNKKNNTGKIIGLIAIAIALGSAIRAGFHGKNILEKAGKETGFLDSIKTGYKNFFKKAEKTDLVVEAEKAKKEVKEEIAKGADEEVAKAAEEVGTKVPETTEAAVENTAKEAEAIAAKEAETLYQKEIIFSKAIWENMKANEEWKDAAKELHKSFEQAEKDGFESLCGIIGQIRTDANGVKRISIINSKGMSRKYISDKTGKKLESILIGKKGKIVAEARYDDGIDLCLYNKKGKPTPEHIYFDKNDALYEVYTNSEKISPGDIADVITNDNIIEVTYKNKEGVFTNVSFDMEGNIVN